MKYEINENILNNIIAFLDRVDYKGLKEVAAIQEILAIFNNPIKEESEKKE